MSNRLDQEREARLQPKRMKYAIEQIEKLGYIVIQLSDTQLWFEYEKESVVFYPYSGWHTGKSIKDGRGIDKLLKQIGGKDEKAVEII